MTDLKNAALGFALQHHGKDNITGSATVVATAQIFEQYLSGALDAKLGATKDSVSTKTQVLPSPAPKPLKEAKAPATAKKPAKTEEQMAAETLAADLAAENTKIAAEAATGETSAEEVKGVIEGLLKANKRKELIALFGKFNAKSFSSIPETQWGSFYEEASDILMSA